MGRSVDGCSLMASITASGTPSMAQLTSGELEYSPLANGSTEPATLLGDNGYHDWARKGIATLSGVRVEAVKLDCRIET